VEDVATASANKADFTSSWLAQGLAPFVVDFHGKWFMLRASENLAVVSVLQE
jgi:hypothetical protein